MQISGVAHLAFENDVDALIRLRSFMSFLPTSNKDQGDYFFLFTKFSVLKVAEKKILIEKNLR